jgi:hypothetical protein
LKQLLRKNSGGKQIPTSNGAGIRPLLDIKRRHSARLCATSQGNHFEVEFVSASMITGSAMTDWWTTVENR